MDFAAFTSLEWVIFLVEMIIFLFASNVIYKRITEPFIKQANKKNDLLKVKETCDGCGNEFDYQLHDHFGYRSCSVDCDEFLDEVFTETKS